MDLGASVNFLPYSFYQQPGLGGLKRIKVTLRSADHSIKKPTGEIEDVLIKVEEFIFPVEFIILGMQPLNNLMSQIPLILVRPFLATSNAMINCQMKISFGNITIDLNILNAEHQSNEPFEHTYFGS